ncbi:hypothetical protein Tco_0098098 [Tanacetum coccineum]
MTGVGRNTNREFTGCDILSPLEKLCPQSLGRSLRCGYRVSEQMRVLLLHLVFAFPGSKTASVSSSFLLALAHVGTQSNDSETVSSPKLHNPRNVSDFHLPLELLGL